MTKDGSNWVGTTLANRYTVEEILGAGGMGTAFRASDHNLKTDVVVKVPHRTMLQDEEFVKRFAQEVRSLVTLSHPHVVSVLDVGEHEGVPYAVMRYLPGGDLKDRCPYDAQGKRLPQDPEKLADWLEDVAKALDFIHAQGYVHRDIKPDNILFDSVRNAYVGDFGIIKAFREQQEKTETASLTQEGVALGTPEYMAPEVVMGEKYDGRADQYALAATVFEMLCGRPPFRGKTPAAIIVKSTTEKAPDPCDLVPSISRKVADCLLKGLARKPSQRFNDCTTFASELLRLVRSENRATIRTHSDDAAKSANTDPDRPTDRYEPSDAQPVVATPPPLTIRRGPTECPNCGHRFTATKMSLLSCPKCSHRFPPPDDSQTPPPMPTRETPRVATETVKQAPPPLPPKPEKKRTKTTDVKVGQTTPQTANPPDAGADSKPAAQPEDKSKVAKKKKKKASKKPQRKRSATIKQPAPKPSDESKPKSPDKPQRTPTLIEPLSNVGTPAAHTGDPTKPDKPQSEPAKKPKPRAKKPPVPTAKHASPAAPAKKPAPAGAKPAVKKRGGRGKLIAFLLTSLVLIGLTTWAVMWLIDNDKSTKPADDGPRVMVAADGSGDYKTIGEAVKKAEPNTRIVVKKGTYKETSLTLDKGVKLIGDDRDGVRLELASGVTISDPRAGIKSMTISVKPDGDGNDRAARKRNVSPRSKAPASVKGKDGKPMPVMVNNVHIQTDRAAIRITAGSPSISECNITSANGTGVIVEGSSTKPAIDGCKFHDCRVAGVHFTKGAGGTLTNGKFDTNRVAGVVVDSGSPQFKKCEFTGAQHCGVIANGGSPTLDDCSMKKIQLSYAVTKEFTDTKREAKGKSSYQLRLPSAGVLGLYGSDVTVRNCTISDCSSRGIRIVGKARIENTSVSDCKSRGLQIDTLGDAVLRTVKVSECGSAAVLLFGKAEVGGNCDFSGGKTSVLYVDSLASGSIVDTIVHDGEGYGLDFGARMSVRNLTVKNNKSAGVNVRKGASLTMTGCSILDGRDYGLKTEASVTLLGCTFKGNARDAVYISDDGRAYLRQKTKLLANRGRGIYCEGKVTVDDCDILDNKSSGIAVYGGTGTISNSRIKTNSAYGVFVTKQTIRTGTKTTRTEPSFVTIRKCTITGMKTPTYKSTGCTLIIDGKSK